MNRSLRKWMKENHVRIVKGDGLFFAVLPGTWSEALEGILPRIDNLLESSFLLKDSPTTTAGLVALDPGGNPVFLKRTNNKGFRFTLRYLFRPARCFRAAIAATRLREIGIDTPEVLAAGERRHCLGILQAGYLVTSSRADIRNASKILVETVDVETAGISFLEAAGRLSARMHAGRMIHGDLKMQNFFYCGNWTPDVQYGLWDLDGARIFSGSPPLPFVLDELARIVSSVQILACQNPYMPEGFPDPFRLGKILMDAYASEKPDLPLPAADALAERSEFRRKKTLLSEQRKKRRLGA